MTAITIPTAEPFFFPGGKTACLLVHGFTGSPKEMRWMGEYLAGQGYTVLGIRLAGHATCPEDMMRTRWRDWLASVEDGWNILCTSSQRIFLMGLSMGGILSLVFASQFPVTGVVTMSTPYALHDKRLAFARLLSVIIPHVDKDLPDWHNPEAPKGHVEYPYNPTLLDRRAERSIVCNAYGFTQSDGACAAGPFSPGWSCAIREHDRYLRAPGQ